MVCRRDGAKQGTRILRSKRKPHAWLNARGSIRRDRSLPGVWKIPEVGRSLTRAAQ